METKVSQISLFLDALIDSCNKVFKTTTDHKFTFSSLLTT